MFLYIWPNIFGWRGLHCQIPIPHLKVPFVSPFCSFCCIISHERVTSDHIIHMTHFSSQSLLLWSTSSLPPAWMKNWPDWVNISGYCHKFLRGEPLLTPVTTRAPLHMLCTQRYILVLANKPALTEAKNAVAEQIDAGLATHLNTFPSTYIEHIVPC